MSYGVSGDVRTWQGNVGENEISGAMITLALADATNDVNAYLEKPFPELVPFAAGDVPALVDSIATSLAVYYVRLAKFPGPGPMSEQAKANFYDKAIEKLGKIQKGEIRLPEFTSKTTRDIKSTQADYTPIFGISPVEDSVVDVDRLEDEADERD